ncbi:MAG TPA: glycosyl hydrolase [Rariglobus sp.]|nr:glycosyl hydrolase [Rariglobus sp.]
MTTLLRWTVVVAVGAAAFFSGGFSAPVYAVPLPPSDNTQAPYMGVYEWGFTQGANINRHDFAASWLARSDLWTEGFAATGTWTDLSGPGWLLDPIAWWVSQDTARVSVLSIGMLPGPWDGSGPTSGPGAGVPVSLATGATGAYNTYFQTLAQALVSKGLANNTVIRLGWEFNGGWYTWRADTQAKALNFAAYWRQIVTTMRAVPGAENLQFCWNGANGWSGYSLADAWPGDAYVDYVGVDFYDQSWDQNTYPYPAGSTPAQILARQQTAWAATAGTNNNGLAWWRDFAVAHNKPFSIPEWGLCRRTDNHGGLDNPYYIQKMYDFIHEPANDVAFHVYFDVQAPDGGHQVTPYAGFVSEFPQAAALYRELFSYSPWSGQDVGAVGTAGTSSVHPSGDATINGAGAGYVQAGTTDAFYYLSQPLSGDGEIVLKVTGMASGSTAQTGLMIRESNAANSRYAAVYLSNGYSSFQTRTTAGAAAVRSAITASVSSPRWLALRRRGSLITAFQSDDGTSWTYAGGMNLTIGSPALIGVAVAGGSGVNATTVTGINLPTRVELDNTASAGVTLTGAWSSSTTTPGFRGTNYLHDGNTGKGLKSVAFAPALASGGTYRVYLNWTADSARAGNVPVTITHANGSTQLTVDQRQQGQWCDLGTYTFAAGNTGRVTLSNAGTTSYVVADAVRFVACPPEVLVQDSTDAAGVVRTGTWSSSTAMPGYFGADYLQDGNTGKGLKNVRYSPTIPASGTYRVLMNWGVGYSNRATNVPVQITGASGVQTLMVNQQQAGNWLSLGDHAFTAGTSNSIQIDTTGTNGYVVADGIRLEAVTSLPSP